MKALRLLGLLVGVFAVMSVMASPAFALPEGLPKQTLTGKNVGNATIETGAGSQIICEEASGELTPSNNALGLFHVHFLKCGTNLGGTCTGLGDTSGILVLGEYHIVWDKLAPTLGVAILFLIEHVHWTCNPLGINTLLLALGSVICLILTPTISSVTHEFHCTRTATKGEQEELHYWNDAGVEQLANLKASVNEGAEEKFALVMLGTLTGAAAWTVENT